MLFYLKLNFGTFSQKFAKCTEKFAWKLINWEFKKDKGSIYPELS